MKHCDSLVVGYRSFVLRAVSSYYIVSIDMDAGTVAYAAVLFYCFDTVVAVDYADVVIAVVMVVSVYKFIIPVLYSIEQGL